MKKKNVICIGEALIDRIRNKENTNKEMSNNTKKPKPIYQERNSHGFPCGCDKSQAK